MASTTEETIEDTCDKSIPVPVEDKKESDKLTHEALVKLTKEAIASIIETDPLLHDLPEDPTNDEIKAATAVAQGQAIRLFLDRGPLPRLTIVVDLKKAIKRQTNVALKREGVNKKISWKHVWKKYHLCFDDLRLTEENEPIDNYGIVNKSVLRYAKKRREKR